MNIKHVYLLIIMSDVDGLYDDNPHNNSNAQLIPLVERVDEKIESIAGESSTLVGTGGMASKVKAAKRATLYGVGVAIVNGREQNVLNRLLDGEEIGTYFLPASNRMTARKQLWVLAGGNGAGKSTFYRLQLEPHGWQ